MLVVWGGGKGKFQKVCGGYGYRALRERRKSLSGAALESAGIRLRRFEPFPAHQLIIMDCEFVGIFRFQAGIPGGPGKVGVQCLPLIDSGMFDLGLSRQSRMKWFYLLNRYLRRDFMKRIFQFSKFLAI
jgi:hypothetical protein